MTKILITGGTGFMGANLVHKLSSSSKNQIHLLTRNSSNYWRINNIQEKLNIHKVDLLEQKKIERIVKKINPEIVFHMAVYGIRGSENDICKTVENNILGTINLFSALENSNNLKRIVNIGTQSEYGLKTNNRSCLETDPLKPITSYGIAKTAQTHFANFYFLKKLPVVTLRVFSPFGKYEDKGRLTTDIMLSLVNNTQLTISSPFITRDFIFIDDVINALIIASKKPKIDGEIFNIGSGHKYMIKEIIELSPNASQLKSNILFSETKKRPFDQMGGKGLVANINKANKILGWKPKFSIKDGLKKSYEWFEENNYLYR